MRTRWRWLFGCSLGTLLGLAWLVGDFGASLSFWLNVQMIGLIATTAIALAGMVTATRKRWPAAVALICFAPIAQALVAWFPELSWLVASAGVPVLVMIAGILGTIVSIGYLLLVPRTPLPDEPLPRARST